MTAPQPAACEGAYVPVARAYMGLCLRCRRFEPNGVGEIEAALQLDENGTARCINWLPLPWPATNKAA